MELTRDRSNERLSYNKRRWELGSTENQKGNEWMNGIINSLSSWNIKKGDEIKQVDWVEIVA